MPRPEKFDRVKKLITYETGHLPIHVEEKKGKMRIVFGKEVVQEKLPDIISKLKLCIPFELDVSIEEE